ncbi:MAG TPA: SpoVG family protein [Elusimicrobiota bacterium]|nr:SpoVG family protein [Elusimicrobiota bacterium]
MENAPAVPGLAARVRLFRSESGKAVLLGFADLTIAESFVIKGIRILETKAQEGGSAGTFVSFPRRKGGEERYFDVAHPVTAAARDKAQAVILESYRSALAESGGAEA